MRKCRPLLVIAALLLAACAGPRTVPVGTAEGYVEIVNPAYTMTPDAPQTIWVPRRHTEGVPRGRELVKKGYEVVKSEIGKTRAAGGVARTSEGERCRMDDAGGSQ